VAQWQLFLDESGSFLSRERQGAPLQRGFPPFLLGGVLIQAPNTPAFADELGDLVDRTFPGVDYPAHATCMHQLSAHALAAFFHHRNGSAAPATGAAEAGARLLEAAARGEVLDREGKVVGAERLDRDTAYWKQPDLAAATAWLEAKSTVPAARAAIAGCRARQNGHRRAIRKLFRDVSARWPTRFVAVSCRSRSALDELGDGDYLELLEGLVERLLAAIEAGAHTGLRLHTAGLWIWTPREEGFPDLKATHVREAARRARSLAGAIGAEVGAAPGVVGVASPARYDRRVHPGVVLADFACHGYGDPRKLRLGRQREALRSQLELELDWQPDWHGSPSALPLVCTTGEGRVRVRAAAGIHDPPKTRRPATGWRDEQAAAWIQALRRGPFASAPSPSPAAPSPAVEERS
jgi:hypothetical protein